MKVDLIKLIRVVVHPASESCSYLRTNKGATAALTSNAWHLEITSWWNLVSANFTNTIYVESSFSTAIVDAVITLHRRFSRSLRGRGAKMFSLFSCETPTRIRHSRFLADLEISLIRDTILTFIFLLDVPYILNPGDTNLIDNKSIRSRRPSKAILDRVAV